MCKCSECMGEGQIEYEVAKPHAGGFNLGYIDSVWETCPVCNGDGDVEIFDMDQGEDKDSWYGGETQ